MIEQVPITQLNAAIYNPRTISNAELGKLIQGIKEFGFVQPVVVNKINNVIIGGHQRVKAAKELGMEYVPVHWVELPPNKEKALNLSLNKISGEWDEEMLKSMLAEMDTDLELTGFDDEEIDKLLAQLAVDNFEPLCDEDEVPEIPKVAISTHGSVWQLGRHTLICADIIEDDISALMNNVQADMCFTDPPYMMNFQGGIGGDGEVNQHAQNHSTIKNDNLNKSDGDEFLAHFCKVLHTNVKGAFYISFYRLGIDRIMNLMTANRLKWRNLIIWFKGHLSLSNSDYKSMYEPIIYGFGDDYTPIVYGWNDEHNFFGAKNNIDTWTDIPVPSFWSIPRTKKNTLHPTMKPVALVERCIINSSEVGDSVVDFFGGSGSTLIACEKTGRICTMFEIEPKYIDTIIKRWQAYTGQDAIDEHGNTFESYAEN